jgi:hypothetical protein
VEIKFSLRVAEEDMVVCEAVEMIQEGLEEVAAVASGIIVGLFLIAVHRNF